MVKKLIQISVFFAALLACKKPVAPPELLYVTPKAGLWLRASASQNGNKIILLPFSMAVLADARQDNPAIIDGKAGHWRRVQYGAFDGFVFDAYLTKNYFSLYKGNEYVAKDWLQRFAGFYEMPKDRQISLINQLINENNKIGDPLEGNNTFSMCMFGLEWRDCAGIMTLPAGPKYASKDDFLKAIQIQLKTPNSEFFKKNTRCVLHVGCMHCDGGFFMPREVFVNELMNLT